MLFSPIIFKIEGKWLPSHILGCINLDRLTSDSPCMTLYSYYSLSSIISACLNHCCLPVLIWHNQQVAQLYFANFILTTWRETLRTTVFNNTENSTAGQDLKEFPSTNKSLEVCILRLTFIPNILWFWGYCIHASYFISAATINQAKFYLVSVQSCCLNSVKNWQLWIILKFIFSSNFPPHSSLSSSSPLVPLLQRWKQWTVDARKKLAIMAATETEMPEKMIMRKSVRVRVIWHSRKLSWESWLRGTRRPSVGKEHSIPSIPV